MPKVARWFLIAIAILVAGRVAVLLNYQGNFYQQQASCRAQAKKEFTIVTGESLPSGYPSHYDATLNLCVFFYQSFPPNSSAPKDFWKNAVTGEVMAEEDSPGDASEETCYFQNAKIDCADFEKLVQQIVTQR